MNGVLILAQGSKLHENERILDSLVLKVRERLGEKLVYPAYLQFSGQDLEAGVDRLVMNGATSITVVPMFLFDGIQTTKDIPQALDEIRGNYPDIKIKMGHLLGDDDRISDIIVDRIKELR